MKVLRERRDLRGAVNRIGEKAPLVASRELQKS